MQLNNRTMTVAVLAIALAGCSGGAPAASTTAPPATPPPVAQATASPTPRLTAAPTATPDVSNQTRIVSRLDDLAVLAGADDSLGTVKWATDESDWLHLNMAALIGRSNELDAYPDNVVALLKAEIGEGDLTDAINVLLAMRDTIATSVGMPSVGLALLPTPEPTPEPTAKPVAITYAKLTSRNWAKIVKAPDKYIGKGYQIWACVFQFDAATGPGSFLANASHKRQEYWSLYGENSWFNGAESKLADIVEDDIVVMNVVSTGSYSYDTQAGGNTTVPAFDVVKITRKGSCG
jgi:hypothetical protein